MHWLYVLKCEDDIYYVGETTRLYRRFNEHINGEGGINTSMFKPENIEAIYPLHKLINFAEYDYNITNKIYNIYFNRCRTILQNFDTDGCDYGHDNFWAENHITESIMINNKDTWKNIRGGKYTRFDVNYSFPDNDFAKSFPVCKCGLPCDVNKNNNYLYFRCAKKNIWDDMINDFDIDCEPCNYFEKYTKDVEYNKDFEKKKKYIWDTVRKSKWLSQLEGLHEHCIGGCGKEYDENNTIRYLNCSINLCFDCFINKNEELSKKYKPLAQNFVLFDSDDE